jgi:hypothetical protein
MPENPNRKVTVPDSPGMVTDLVNRIKLIIRLLGDRRVNPLIKLLPIGSALYFIIPDLVIGPLDDAAIIWLATYLFVELCPPDLVDEHMRAIQGLPAAASGGGTSTGDEEIIDGEVIDAEFQDK